MKYRLKKVLALLMTTALLFTVLEINAFASETDGMLRLLLTRPGSVSEMSIVLSDAYMIKETNKQLAIGDVLTVLNENGTIILNVNGKQAVSGESIELLQCGNGQSGFTFTMPALNNIYSGDLNLTAEGDIITPILTIYLEDYLYGVVSAAMSSGTNSEALKAEAVVARSFILCKRAAQQGTAYDAMDSAADQLYNGYDTSRNDAKTAVDATAGEVLYSNGAVAACYTTTSNGGQTESAANVWGTPLSYSVMKIDSYDAENADATVKTASLKQDGSDMNASLRGVLIDGMAAQLESWNLSTSANDIEINAIDAIDLMNPKYEGSLLYQQLNFHLSVQSVNLSTGKPVNCTVNVAVPTYSGFENWYNLSINTTDNETVSVAKVNDEYKVMFRREGHGIGLSCCGAQVMASVYAKDYKDILDFYYPGTELKTETLKRADNGAAQTEKGTTSYALPTLVPRATIEPTAEPTQAVEWTTPEPQITATAEPIFAEENGASDKGNTFIAGTTAVNAQTEPVQNSPTPTAAATVPVLEAATEKPEATATPEPALQTEEPPFDADEVIVGDLDIEIDDIDYDIGDDDGLGALDTGGDPDAEDFEEATEGESSENDIALKDFDIDPEYDIDTNVDDDSVLGPMLDGEEEPNESAETDEKADMKEADGSLFGKVNVEEGSTLTLRSGASVNSAAIAYLSNGTPVCVLAYNSDWLYVITKNSEKGYLSRPFVERISETEAAALGWGDEDSEHLSNDSAEDDSQDDEEDVLDDYSAEDTDIVICDFNAKTTANVRLHENPSLTSFTLMTIAGGEIVNVAAYNDEWAYVEYSGVCGYIYRAYLKKA